MVLGLWRKLADHPLSADILNLFVGKIGGMIAGLLALTVATRITTRADFGAYIYGVAIVNLCLIVGLMGFQRLTVREVAKYTGRKNTEQAINFASHVAVRVLVFLTITALVVFTSMGLITNDPDLLIIARISLILVIPFGLLRLSEAFLRGRKQFLLSPIADQVARPMLFCITVVSLYYFTPIAAIQFVVGQFIGAIAALVIVLYVFRKLQLGQYSYFIKGDNPDSILHDGFTLGLVSFSAALFSQLPILSLGYFSTADSVALFAAPARVGLMVGLLFTVVNQALSPSIAQLWERGDKAEMARVATYSSSIALLVSLIIAMPILIFPEWILKVIVGDKFQQAKNILIIVTIAQLFNVATGSVTSWLTMTGHQSAATKANVVSLIVACLAAVYLVPTYHETGAALVFAIGVLVSNSIQVFSVIKYLNFNPTAVGIFMNKRKSKS